jgi:very-short-patch-repair endonuclease
MTKTLHSPLQTHRVHEKCADYGGPEPPAVVAARVAAGQHGVATLQQLLDAGLSAAQIRRRRGHGWLVRLHKGVYRVGLVAAPSESLMAAVLACGEGAVISHATAAVEWRLSRTRPGPVHVTIPHGHRSHGPALQIHRCSRLTPADRTLRDGIPMTTPARTLLDLAAVAPSHDLEHALAAAERLRLVARHEISALIDRMPHARGGRALRSLLGRDHAPAFLRSEAERLFLELARSAELPEPRVNAELQGYEVDFLWREQRLVVEIDGNAYHSSRNAFETDRRRDAVLTAAGYQVMRVTWHQLQRSSSAVVARLAQALVVPRA